MVIHMTDPQSLLAWIRRAPKHNAAQALAIARLRPEIKPAVDEALRMAREIRAQQRGQQQHQPMEAAGHGTTGER